MEILYKRCCGIDVHKNMLIACVFMGVRKKEIRQFGTMTDDILQLTKWLNRNFLSLGITLLFHIHKGIIGCRQALDFLAFRYFL